MKIYIIRHGKVNMQWEKKGNSKQYDQARGEYDQAKIFTENCSPLDIKASKIYISSLPRTRQTAKLLFPNKDYIIHSNIHEVPLCSAFDSRVSYPMWFWNVLGRLQWLINSERQEEGKLDTQVRAQKVCQSLEDEEEDIVLITHGFFMITFVKELEKHGFTIQNKKLFYKNLDLVEAIG